MKTNEKEIYTYRGVTIEKYVTYNQVSRHHKKNEKNSGVMVLGQYLPTLELAKEYVDFIWVDFIHAEILKNNRLISDGVFVF